MSAMLERTAQVKAEIIKALAELEHGDAAAAIQALATGLTNMLELMMEQNEVISRITLQLEHDYKGIDVLLHRLEKQMEPAEPEPTAAGKEVRAALDTLRAESTRSKRK